MGIAARSLARLQGRSHRFWIGLYAALTAVAYGAGLVIEPGEARDAWFWFGIGIEGALILLLFRASRVAWLLLFIGSTATAAWWFYELAVGRGEKGGIEWLPLLILLAVVLPMRPIVLLALPVGVHVWENERHRRRSGTLLDPSRYFPYG